MQILTGILILIILLIAGSFFLQGKKENLLNIPAQTDIKTSKQNTKDTKTQQNSHSQKEELKNESEDNQKYTSKENSEKYESIDEKIEHYSSFYDNEIYKDKSEELDRYLEDLADQTAERIFK